MLLADLCRPIRRGSWILWSKDVARQSRHGVEVCGVGPWFYVDHLPVTGFTYAGRRYEGVPISIALANSGDVQLELTQQRPRMVVMCHQLP